jgi:flagellar hook-associated protein 3 FlgL
MALISIGDLAQSFMLRKHNATLKADVMRLSEEVTTGLKADPAKHLSGDISALTGIDSALARLGALSRAASDQAFFTGAMQTALGAVQDLTSDLVPSLLAVTTTGTTGSMNIVSREAERAFQSVVGLYNTRLGDRALFSGDQTATTALLPADQILQQMGTAIAGALTVQDVETALDTWLSSPTGYLATAYQGGAPIADVPISPGQSVSVDVTAADPAIRETLKGLGMAALLQQGLFTGDPAIQAELIRRSGEVLASGQNSRALLAGQLGTSEGQIEDARSRNAAEVSSLQIARVSLLSVDQYDAAARLQEAQGQLEMLYTLTARLSRLSLVDFLR